MKKPWYVKDKIVRDTVSFFYYKCAGDMTSASQRMLQMGLVIPFGFIRLSITTVRLNFT